MSPQEFLVYDEFSEIKILKYRLPKKNSNITFKFCNEKGNYKFMELIQNAIMYQYLLGIAVTVTTNGAVQVMKLFDAGVAKYLTVLH